MSVVGFPKVYWYGSENGKNIVVMEYLGPTLETLFQYCGRKFSLKTQLLIAKQLVMQHKEIRVAIPAGDAAQISLPAPRREAGEFPHRPPRVRERDPRHRLRSQPTLSQSADASPHSISVESEHGGDGEIRLDKCASGQRAEQEGRYVESAVCDVLFRQRDAPVEGDSGQGQERQVSVNIEGEDGG